MPQGDELQNARPEAPLSNDVLEGGAVEPLEDYPVAEKHRADTARYLAYSARGNPGTQRRFPVLPDHSSRLHGENRRDSNTRQNIQHLDAIVVRPGRRGNYVLLHKEQDMTTVTRPGLPGFPLTGKPN